MQSLIAGVLREAARGSDRRMAEPKQGGMLQRAMDAVSETFHGAAEGLRHGTQMAMGTGSEAASTVKGTPAAVLAHPLEKTVEGKEAARDGINKATEPPTPNEPSIADRAKEAFQNLA